MPWESVSLALSVLALIGLGGMLLGLIVVLLGSKLLPQQQTVGVAPPVSGRWLAMNSPATKVPSHGVRAYGQAHAIDLVYEPESPARPAFGSGPAMPSSTAYPAFGQPVRSMVDGVVVQVSELANAITAHCADIYNRCDDANRRLCNQAFFTKIYIDERR